jgi:hypothetical protein
MPPFGFGRKQTPALYTDITDKEDLEEIKEMKRFLL